MSTSKRYARVAYAMALLALTTAFRQASCYGTISNPVLNIDSNCTGGQNADWSNLQITPHLKFPFCPVKVKYPNLDGIEPAINLTIEVWDIPGNRNGGDGVELKVKNATGGQIAYYFAYFGVMPAQPNGNRIANLNTTYVPGTSGYNVAQGRDKDVANYFFLPYNSAPSNANGFANLAYVPETGVTVSGATSYAWGDTPPTVTGNLTKVRRPATIKWKLDNVLVRTATVGWNTEYDYIVPTVTSTGSHTIKAEVTSGTSTATVASKTFNVNAPPDCSRLAPDTALGDVPLAPGTPPHNSCPPVSRR